MALRDILVCLDGTAAGRSRLELALNLALDNKAHLTAVYASPKPRDSAARPAGVGLPPTVLGPVSPEGARAIGRQPIGELPPAPQVLRDAERAEAVERRFREELPVRALDGEWHMLDHTDLVELLRLVKAADLAILGQYPGDDSHGVTWLRPDDLMVDSGRPVLIVPYAGTFEWVGRRVLVAWDGTPEASRALHDALPLIAGAEAVTVMHVGAQQTDLDRDRPWLERVVRHLARHGIKAQPEESVHGGIPVSDVLLSRAADLGADCIVAGAYHHSHLRESLLGGVSRELLDHMTVPVLMSH
ncbi:MAG: universal stress protein [Alphaproteobacteria bacterium]|nr:universal stress protein [Alphaproteobacteria bacterium]MBV8336954.1 universal stress protein [Alphaproteobacteria bacterium]